MKSTVTYGIVTDPTSSTRVRCVFCGIFLPKASKCIEQHTKGSKHQENIDLMSESAIRLLNDVLYCKICKRNLAENESVPKHTEDDEHATWMAAIEDLVDGEFINIDSYLASETDHFTCEACDSTIECQLPNLEDHVNSFNHRANVCEKIKPMNGIFPVENNEEVWCKICDGYLENTIKSIVAHSDDDESHVNWIADLEDMIEGHDIVTKEYLTNEHEQNVFCNKCQVPIVCDFDRIQEHVDSEVHLSHFDDEEPTQIIAD